MLPENPKKRSESRERGANLVEYMLLVSFILLLSLVSIRLMGTEVSEQFSTVASTFG